MLEPRSAAYAPLERHTASQSALGIQAPSIPPPPRITMRPRAHACVCLRHRDGIPPGSRTCQQQTPSCGGAFRLPQGTAAARATFACRPYQDFFVAPSCCMLALWRPPSWHPALVTTARLLRTIASAVSGPGYDEASACNMCQVS